MATGTWLTILWRLALALLAAAALACCGSLPKHVDTLPSAAVKPTPGSPLVRIALDSIPAPELSGFRLMPLGIYSLDARVQLVRRARYSLDLQYYLIDNDQTGHLLLRNLRDAALRGDTKTLFHVLDLLERVVPIATFMDFCTELDELRLQGVRPRPH